MTHSNNKEKTARMPEYLKSFRCIGPACGDNCCIGWDVEFDRKSFKKYQKFEDEELAKLFDKVVYVNRLSFSSDVDYAKVRLGADKRCPFLNDHQLCRIQAKLGEDYLSNVCATYPRYTNEVDGVLEQSANVSCPEAARLALKQPEGIRFLEEKEAPGKRHIINLSVKTGEGNKQYLERYLIELRGFTIWLLQFRKYDLVERLLLLGLFYRELQTLADTGKTDRIPALVSSFTQKIESGLLIGTVRAMPSDPAIKMRLLRELVDKLNAFTEIDSKRYVSFMKEFLKGIQYNRKASPEENAKRYSLSHKQYYEPFLKTHGYILENYLVNFVFSNLFPALGDQKPWNSLIMLTLLAALVSYHLEGIAASRRGLTADMAVEFIQVFSKTVEHHKSYLDTITDYMRKKRYDTLNYMSILLK